MQDCQVCLPRSHSKQLHPGRRPGQPNSTLWFKFSSAGECATAIASFLWSGRPSTEGRWQENLFHDTAKGHNTIFQSIMTVCDGGGRAEESILPDVGAEACCWFGLWWSTPLFSEVGSCGLASSLSQLLSWANLLPTWDLSTVSSGEGSSKVKRWIEEDAAWLGSWELIRFASSAASSLLPVAYQ